MQTIRTPEKEDKILRALEEHPSKARAFRKARVSKSSFYTWQRQDPDFKQRVDEAQRIGIDAVEDQLLEDAIEGNTTAQIFALKTWRPEKYGDRSEIKHTGDDEHPVGIRLVRT